MITCNKCNAELAESFKFCYRCGCKLILSENDKKNEISEKYNLLKSEIERFYMNINSLVSEENILEKQTIEIKNLKHKYSFIEEALLGISKFVLRIEDISSNKDGILLTGTILKGVVRISEKICVFNKDTQKVGLIQGIEAGDKQVSTARKGMIVKMQVLNLQKKDVKVGKIVLK